MYAFLGRVVGIAFIGAVAYMVDKNLIGVRLWRFLYNAAHENPLSPEQEFGFLYKRNAKARFAWATAAVLSSNILLFWIGWRDPFWMVPSVIVEILSLMGGFYCGPWLDHIWARKDPLLGVVDELESGKRTMWDVWKDAREATRRKFGIPKRSFSKAVPSPKAAKETNVSQAVNPETVEILPAGTEVKEAKAEEPPFDPRVAIDKFTHGR